MSDDAREAMPDPRPRPQFGEYATREEQQARIKDPDASTALDLGLSPAAGVPPVPPPPVAPGDGEPISGRARAPHPVDRIVTIVLLAYGAFNVIFSAMSFLNLADVANEALRILGATEEFTNFAAARLWGPIAAIVLVAGFVVTALLSVRRLRAGRITWWLPLVGAVATYLVVYVCLAIPLLGDPAFIGYATSGTPGL